MGKVREGEKKGIRVSKSGREYVKEEISSRGVSSTPKYRG